MDPLENKLKEALFKTASFKEKDGLFTQEVHLFMHCHMKGYDRTGEGLQMDHSFFDKYGVPTSIHNYWMEGYHSMDRMLLQHKMRVDNDKAGSETSVPCWMMKYSHPSMKKIFPHA